MPISDKNLRVHIIQGSGRRDATICQAFKQGITFVGDRPTVYQMHQYRLHQEHPDVLLFYGYGSPRRELMAAAMPLGIRCVYVDLGYWGRVDGGRFAGFHKCVVDALHPDSYFQDVPRSGARADHHKEARWNAAPRGDAILVAGMSEKAAWTFDLKPEQWEKLTIARLRELTDRPILYRPKPSWHGARPIPGADYADPRHDIQKVLHSGIWAVVTHHSNVACDALLRGIPNISVRGVASVMGTNQLKRIDALETPERRDVEKWKNQVAWTQWNVREMGNGQAWRYLKSVMAASRPLVSHEG